MGKSFFWSGRAVRRAGAGAGLALALALTGGCESARDSQLLENPNYLTGYSDGCQTGHTRVAGFDDSVTRNEALASGEPAYQIGWRDGYQACGGGGLEADTASGREIFWHDSEHYTSAPR